MQGDNDLCKWRLKSAEEGGEARAVKKCGPFFRNPKETNFQGGKRGVSRHEPMDPDPLAHPPRREEEPNPRRDRDALEDVGKDPDASRTARIPNAIPPSQTQTGALSPSPSRNSANRSGIQVTPETAAYRQEDLRENSGRGV